MKKLMIGFLCVFPCVLSASQEQALEIEKLTEACVAFRTHVHATVDQIDQRLNVVVARVDKLERDMARLKSIREPRPQTSTDYQLRRQHEINEASAAGLSLRAYRAGLY